MASTNGTFVNGKKVTRVDLADGDTIRGGETVLQVSIDAEEDAHTAKFPCPEPDPSSDTLVSLAGYRIERELGRGGMGVVYLARKDGGPPVALKTILPSAAASENAVARFLREASVLRKLAHPHIVPFREMGHADGRIYFAMDFIEGLDAARLLKEHGGPLPIPRAVELVCQALDALAYAHDRGFVHRDIKPQNLLVSRREGRDHIHVADFGLARIYQTSTLSGLTFKDEIGGTVGYVAPEQITNFRESKPSADQYSAGVTLYFLLTGQLHHDLNGPLQWRLLTILQNDPIPIRDRREDIPSELADVVHRALAREPKDRFPDVLSVKNALTGFRPMVLPR